MKKADDRKAVDAKVCREVIERLDKFFKGTPYSLEWSRARNGRIGVAITYTDFFSEVLTRKMLTDVIPQNIRYSVRREFSDKAVARVLLQEYRKNRVAIVDCYNGELRPETIQGFVSRVLGGVEML